MSHIILCILCILCHRLLADGRRIAAKQSVYLPPSTEPSLAA